MRGHKRGCRCVGCSPATRARGMAALRRRTGGQSAGSRRNAQPARPPVKPPRLEQIARRAAQDAGNRSMRKAGRKQWSQADWHAATREYHRVLGTDLAEGNPPSRRVGGIPGTLTRVEYVRTGKHPGKYYHKFGRGVRAFALADGSLLLKGPRRLFVRQ